MSDHFAIPLIVKPHDDGCSVLVSKVSQSAELPVVLETLFAHGKNYAMIEEYIGGMELAGGVIGNNNPQALLPSQTIANSGILSIQEKFYRCFNLYFSSSRRNRAQPDGIY